MPTTSGAEGHAVVSMYPPLINGNDSDTVRRFRGRREDENELQNETLPPID